MKHAPISNRLLRFSIQLISNVHTNHDYSMVCISVYGRKASFFNKIILYVQINPLCAKILVHNLPLNANFMSQIRM